MNRISGNQEIRIWGSGDWEIGKRGRFYFLMSRVVGVGWIIQGIGRSGYWGLEIRGLGDWENETANFKVL